MRALCAQGDCMNILKFTAIIIVVFAISGCEKNPLLGTWKVKTGQNKLMIVCPEITFTDDISKCGSIVEEVSYDVQDNTVIVSSELGDALGMKVAYEISDSNTMTIDIPMGGKLVYGRSSY
jgi:hypothetical protein